MQGHTPLDVAGIDVGARDTQTVTPDGRPVQELLSGVVIREAVTHIDERGSVCEIYDPAWGFIEKPLVYVYQITIRPGRVKGWIVHLEQDDRLFFSLGDAKVVLFDGRLDSPTFESVSVFHFGQSRRALLRIPRGVYHAIKMSVSATQC